MESPEGPSPRQAPAGSRRAALGAAPVSAPGAAGLDCSLPAPEPPRRARSGAPRGEQPRARAPRGRRAARGRSRPRSCRGPGVLRRRRAPGTRLRRGRAGQEAASTRTSRGQPWLGSASLPALPCNCTKPLGSASPASLRSVMQLHLRTGCRWALLCAICRVSETSTSSWAAVRAPQLCPASVCVVGSVA